MDSRNILSIISREVNIVSDPDYYSGRGLTLSDLDSKIIGRIHAAIRRNFGPDAAKEFVRMVGDLPSRDFAMSRFLDHTRNLQFHEWKWNPKNPLRNYGSGNDMAALGAIGAAFGQSTGSRFNMDKKGLNDINAWFLRRHHPDYRPVSVFQKVAKAFERLEFVREIRRLMGPD